MGENCDKLLCNLLVHQVPGTGEEEDENNNCHEICIPFHRSHGYRKNREEKNQDQEGCKSDDHIKNTFVHCYKFSLSEDIGLSDFLLYRKHFFPMKYCPTLVPPNGSSEP